MEELKRLQSMQKELLAMQKRLQLEAQKSIEKIPEGKDKDALMHFYKRLSDAKDANEYNKLSEEVLSFINGNK